MTESQRRAFSRQSETRQAVNILQRADQPNGEAIEKARREFDESEIEVRAALATDDDEVIEESEIDAEVRERSEIRSRARVAAYIAAAADQQPLTGAEHELSAAYGLPAGHMPIEMLQPETRENGEVRTVTPGVSAPGASSGISPIVFEASAAASLGVTFPVVPSGQANFAVMTTAPTATPLDQSSSAPATAGAFRLDTRTPTRISGQFEVEVEDLALLPNMEESLRGSIAEVIAEAVDSQVIAGNNSGANLNGLFQQATNVTADTAVETFQKGVARYAALVDGKYASGWGDMRAIIGSKTFALYASLFRNGSDGSLFDYLVSKLGSIRVSDRVPAVSSMAQKNIAVLTGGNQPIRVPVWRNIRLIRDEFTGAGDGKIVVTALVLVGDPHVPYGVSTIKELHPKLS